MKVDHSLKYLEKKISIFTATCGGCHLRFLRMHEIVYQMKKKSSQTFCFHKFISHFCHQMFAQSFLPHFFPQNSFTENFFYIFFHNFFTTFFSHNFCLNLFFSHFFSTNKKPTKSGLLHESSENVHFLFCSAGYL